MFFQRQQANKNFPELPLSPQQDPAMDPLVGLQHPLDPQLPFALHMLI